MKDFLNVTYFHIRTLMRYYILVEILLSIQYALLRILQDFIEIVIEYIKGLDKS